MYRQLHTRSMQGLQTLAKTAYVGCTTQVQTTRCQIFGGQHGYPEISNGGAQSSFSREAF